MQSCLARVQGILSETELITWDYDEDQDSWSGRLVGMRMGVQCTVLCGKGKHSTFKTLQTLVIGL